MSLQRSSGSDRDRRGGFALVGTIGGYAVLCILAGLGIGYMVDRAAHTSPLFLISGVVLGFVLSFVLVYKLAMRELGD